MVSVSTINIKRKLCCEPIARQKKAPRGASGPLWGKVARREKMPRRGVLTRLCRLIRGLHRAFSGLFSRLLH